MVCQIIIASSCILCNTHAAGGESKLRRGRDSSAAAENFNDLFRSDPGEVLPVGKLRAVNNGLLRIRTQEQRFSGMDCGACGAPSCHALAEDIVEGMANEDQCIFLMREKLQKRLYGRQSDL